MKLVVLYQFLVAFTAASEKVWLRELDAGSDKRGKGASLLEFELKRPKGLTKLKLKENTRINANAPVFDVSTDSKGKQRLLKHNKTPKMTTKFYQDKESGGSFEVKLDKKTKSHILSGSLRLDNEWFDILTEPQSSNSTNTSLGLQYELKEHPKKGDVKRKKNNGQDEILDKQAEDEVKTSGVPWLLQKIRSIIKGNRKKPRTKRSIQEYAVEVFVAADPSVWTKFFDITSATDELTQEQATELRLREHFVNRVNGMSLRFESIDDPDMKVYLTISGFLFLKAFSDSNPLPPDSAFIEYEGAMVADGNVYMAAIRDWAADLSGLPHNDHIMVFTDHDIFTSDSGTSIAGLAYPSAMCTALRVSVVEDGGAFRTVSVGAHEIGHNMGAGHDGDQTSSACPPEDKYIMAPSVATFAANEAYTANPWTFSPCSIQAFKTYISSLGGNNCLLDAGDYYNQTEYNIHLELLPGQRVTVDDQCRHERGPGSHLCISLTPPEASDFCRRKACYEPSDDLCYFSTPARGTDCGDIGDTTYCIDGQCVQKADEHIQQSDGDMAGQAAAAEGTTTNGGINITCIDTGYNGFNCTSLDNYFFETYNASAAEWCLDPDWEARCCVYCRESEERMAKQTTTVDKGAEGENTGGNSDTTTTGDNTGDISDTTTAGDNTGYNGDTTAAGDNTGDNGGMMTAGDNTVDNGDTTTAGDNTGYNGYTTTTGDNTVDNGDTTTAGDNTGDNGGTTTAGDNTVDNGDTTTASDNTGNNGDTTTAGDNTVGNGDTTTAGGDTGYTGDTTTAGDNTGDNGGTTTAGDNTVDNGDTTTASDNTGNNGDTTTAGDNTVGNGDTTTAGGDTGYTGDTTTAGDNTVGNGDTTTAGGDTGYNGDTTTAGDNTGDNDGTTTVGDNTVDNGDTTTASDNTGNSGDTTTAGDNTVRNGDTTTAGGDTGYTGDTTTADDNTVGNRDTTTAGGDTGGNGDTNTGDNNTGGNGNTTTTGGDTGGNGDTNTAGKNNGRNGDKTTAGDKNGGNRDKTTAGDKNGGTEACVDTGYKKYDCSFLDNYFIETYNTSADQWCLYTEWEARCCAYCREHTTTTTTTTTPSPGSCVDIGWTEGNWTCEKVAAYFLDTNAKWVPSFWCRVSKWKKNCCVFCSVHGV